MHRLVRAFPVLLALVAFGGLSPLAAQPASGPVPAIAPALQARAGQLVAILAAPGGEEAFFSPVFLKAVPVAQWRALAEQLRTEHGAPVALRHLRAQSPTIAAVEIGYARATVGFQMVVAPQSAGQQAPGQVIGLRITGVRQAEDSLTRVQADIAALPGKSAFTIARLTDSGPVTILSGDADRPMATGSSFKLFVLAELARAVAAGERRWSDVIPLGPKSFSGRLSAAPDHAPMTLHSLALAMIAESDNSAADTLLLALDRDRVDALAPPATRPLLTTAEAFALKMPANAELRARYAAAPAGERRRLLRDNAARLRADAVDVGAVAAAPVAIDSIEWFATPGQMVGLLDGLRKRGGDALPIMAVNPGIGRGDAARWRYLGYKGGSEPGVIAMNFLGQAKDGQYYAIAAAWNDPAALVDDDRFVALMTRILNLVADGA